MQSDGSLKPSEHQIVFSKHYGAIEVITPQPVTLFGEIEETSPAPSPRRASPEILLAIQDVAMRYAASDSLRAAGLSVLDWMTLYQANIEIESGYDPKAESPVGAVGLGQLMPDTAKALAVDPYDIPQNLDGSARYLLAMLLRFGDPKLALAAYNAGPEAVEKYNGIPPYAETQGHVEKVMAVFLRLKGDVE
ncbi:MAG: lytic transglycosylase domain-containing protein [Deltaproteobacteria bacterium]